MEPIGLYYPLDGVNNPKYKLSHFLTTKIKFCKEKKALAFNRDRCCHLSLCLQLILFYWVWVCRFFSLLNSLYLKMYLGGGIALSIPTVGSLLKPPVLQSWQGKWTKHSCNVMWLRHLGPMRLCQPPDGSTSPKYKLLCFITTNFFLKREERTSF